jgi:hypothetical protein
MKRKDIKRNASSHNKTKVSCETLGKLNFNRRLVTALIVTQIRDISLNVFSRPSFFYALRAEGAVTAEMRKAEVVK